MLFIQVGKKPSNNEKNCLASFGCEGSTAEVTKKRSLVKEFANTLYN